MDFTTGITIVNGKNGSGKSNFTHVLLFFALTGETPPRSGTKKELLNWMSKSGHTKLSFRYHERTYELVRNINNSSVAIRSTDEGPAVDLKQADANSFMIEVIGMPVQAFYKTCFAPQQRLTQVIKMTHGERMTYFQQLFGTEKAEKLRGLIKTYQDKLPNYPDRTAALVALGEDITRLDASEAQIRVSWESYSSSVLAHEKAALEMRKILSLPSESEHGTSVDAARRAVINATDVKTQYEMAHSIEQPAEPTCGEPDPEGAVKLQQKKYLLDTEENLRKLEQDLSSRPAPAADPGDRPTMDAVVEANRLVTELLPLKRLAEQGVCPTCARPHTLDRPTEDILKEYEVAQTNASDAQRVYEDAVRQWDACVAEINRYNSQWSGLEQQISSLKASALQFDQPGVRDFDESIFNSRTLEWQSYRNAVTAYNTHLSSLNTYVQDIARLEGVLSAASVAPYSRDADIQVAKNFETQFSEVRATLSNLQSSLASTQSEKTSAESLRKGYLTEQENRSKVIQTIEKFEKARKLLHKDNLQKQVMSKALGTLNMVMDEYLGHFGKDYSAWIDGDFDFRASKPDNSDFRAGLLSGGEQMALSMAYMLAIAEVKGSNIPLMVLDEPTDGLDNEAIHGLIEVLKIARSYAEKGLYILIPSHAPEMEAAKSQVLSMEEMSV
jgi:DNA repair exonuclease SbcCD ATPase subunit